MSAEIQTIQRNFIVGDEWLYFKIYTGYKTSETILREAIYPVAGFLLNEQFIDRWFFIRYNDPKYHIRIRFHLTDRTQIAAVILNLNEAIKQFVDDDIVWKVQIDTYQREVERYGVNTMELSEELFFYDSMTIVNLISALQGNESENMRWLLSMKMIDVFLSDFGFDLQKKNELLDSLSKGFAREFEMENDPNKQLSAKYRNHKVDIEQMMKGNLPEPYNELIVRKSVQISPLATQILQLNVQSEIETGLSSLLGSYIHMMVNRFFRTNQRKYELVIYDFLSRYYYSRTKQEQKQVLGK